MPPPFTRPPVHGQQGAARALVLVGVALSLALVVLSLGAMTTSLSRPAEPRVEKRPNLVLIVADDLDSTLMPFMPHVRRLIGDQGATLDRFYVEQGTCCTSRATILSGQYAHNHHVEANAWPLGGFERWHADREQDALPVWLNRAGYRTALMGKYFNEYPAPASFDPELRQSRMSFVPPGWDDWMVPVQGNAYAQRRYRLNVNGAVDPQYRETFLDDVLGDHLTSLVGGSSGFDLGAGGSFLYYASYSPHTPYAHPAQYDEAFGDVTYPRTAAFDEADTTDKLGMTATKRPLTPAYEAEIDEAFRERVRSVQTLDRNVRDLVEALRDEGSLEDTYVMFVSDNGYTMGEHRREIGKYNQFEETVRVPMMIRGPGITPGTVVDDVTGNVDLAPTIAAITGAQAPYAVDGVDLLPRLTGQVATLDRDGLLLGRALLPQYRTAPSPIDEVPEDFVADDEISRLNDFTGVVTRRWKLVRYSHLPFEELYDLAADPDELTNLLPDGAASYAAMTPQQQQVVTGLRSALDRLQGCRGSACR
ncbi:MAG: sulfatase [Nocardioides sp.]|nr:sulfatase [Nocardioides sp.]